MIDESIHFSRFSRDFSFLLYRRFGVEIPFLSRVVDSNLLCFYSYARAGGDVFILNFLIHHIR
jgi:hypothetical protein